MNMVFRNLLPLAGVLAGMLVSLAQQPVQGLVKQLERIRATELTEESFRKACSLIDELEEYDAVIGMEQTNAWIERVRPLNHRRWMHGLLTNKYELAQLVYPFLDSATVLAARIASNAGSTRDALFRESTVYAVHAYGLVGGYEAAEEWLDRGMADCEAANDSLNLAMLCQFKGDLLYRGQPDSAATALRWLQQAQKLSAHLPNQTACFFSAYRAAHISHVNNPSALVNALEALIPLSKDASLIKLNFGHETFFTFAKPTFTIYLDLMRLNLVIMDIHHARRIYQLIEGTLEARKRKTGFLSDRSLGMLVSDRAVIEAFAGERQMTARLLDSCRNYFGQVPEDAIPSVNYFLAKTMLNELEGDYPTMLQSMNVLESKYVGAVLPLSLATLYARAYALNGDVDRARLYFDRAATQIGAQIYSARGYYYYRYYAAWLYDQRQFASYAKALHTFYGIKDSIASIHQMRNIAEIETVHFVKEREKEIAYLNRIRDAEVRAGRAATYAAAGVFAALLLTMGIVYARYRQNGRHNTALREKNARIETLIRELHHRVKNNLQVVSSLLSLQSLRMKEGDEREALIEGQRRVEAMALIHQKLYQHEDVTGVDMKAYIEELVLSLADSYGASAVQVDLDIAEIRMDIDTAMPLGLIINELVTNSLKYGIGSGGSDRLAIRLRDGPTGYALVLADNGPGLPIGFRIEESRSFGLKLVHTLAKQLRATVACSGRPGTVFELAIPLLKTAGISETENVSSPSRGLWNR